jgi:hypothetical protein
MSAAARSHLQQLSPAAGTAAAACCRRQLRRVRAPAPPVLAAQVLRQLWWARRCQLQWSPAQGPAAAAVQRRPPQPGVPQQGPTSR